MFGSSSRSKVFQGSSKDLCQQRSFEDLRKSFEFNGRPRTFGRSSRWKPVQGSLQDRRDQRLFKGIRKFFDIEGHSRIFGRSLRSKIIQGPSEYLRYQISSFCNSLPQNTRCYFKRAILLSFGHRGLLVNKIETCNLGFGVIPYLITIQCLLDSLAMLTHIYWGITTLICVLMIILCNFGLLWFSYKLFIIQREKLYEKNGTMALFRKLSRTNRVVSRMGKGTAILPAFSIFDILKLCVEYEAEILRH